MGEGRVMSVASEAKQLGRSRWVDRAGRFGFVARGLLWGAVAVLALEVALGFRNGPPEGEGALSVIADRPLGGVLLPVLAIGFAAHALWRLGEAIAYRPEHDESRLRAVKSRVVLVSRAVLYAVLAGAAGWFALGGGGGENEQERTRDAFNLPGGRYLVGAIGLAILGAGLYNCYCAMTAGFREDLREHRLREGVRGWVIALGIAGYAGRGAVFALIGFFLMRATVQYDASETKGLDGALRTLLEQPYGQVLVGAVGAGLGCYALFCFVAAVYARS